MPDNESAGKNPTDLRALDFKHEIGVSGLRRRHGRVQEEFLDKLKGPRRAHVVQQMLYNDPVIGGIEKAIRNLLLKPKWHIDAADKEDPKEVEKAEFIESCFHDMSVGWNTTLDEILSFLPHGWYWGEVVLKRRRGFNVKPGLSSRFNDGLLGIRKIATRSQDTLDRWEFGEDGGVRGIWQRDPNSFEEYYIPIEKSLHFRTRSHKGDPEGLSMLRSAVRPWMIKKEIEEIEAIGVERDVVGIPKFRAPMEWFDTEERTPAQAAALKALEDAAKNFRMDEQAAIGIPSVPDGEGGYMIDFELISSPGQKMFDTTRIITRWDTRIAVSMLAGFILLGQTGIGSFALASVSVELLETALEAHLDSAAEVFQRHLIPRLLIVNGFDIEQMPTIRHDPVRVPDLSQLSLYLQRLGQVEGVNFDSDLRGKLREVAELPPENEAEILEDTLEERIPEILEEPVLPEEGRQEPAEEIRRSVVGGGGDLVLHVNAGPSKSRRIKFDRDASTGEILGAQVEEDTGDAE